MSSRRRWLRPPLGEADFIRIVLIEQLTQPAAAAEYGITRDQWYESLRIWKPKYKQEIKTLRAARHAKHMYGNKRGARAHASFIINRDELVEYLEARLRLPEIARRVGCSEFLVKQNIERYGLAAPSPMPVALCRFMTEAERKVLERLSPGIIEEASDGGMTPSFYERLYGLHLEVLQASWLIKRLGKGYFRQHKDKRICWSSNEGETKFALLLRRAAIPHTRQEMLAEGKGASSIDFLVDGLLFVEVDGTAHQLPQAQEADRRKEAQVLAMGRSMLRVTQYEVEERPEDVLNQVRFLLMSLRSFPSTASVWRLSGTSPSPKTTAMKPKAL